MTSDPLVEELAGVVGLDHVLVDDDVRASYETDWTRRFSGTARFVVRPGDTGEVSAVLAVCARAGAAVVPQGGNTGLVGGGVPRGGEVVLSLTRLRALEPVDVEAAEVTVGAGVTLAELQAHAVSAGLAFGVDLAARDSATIGGMVATNAGGIHVLRYGPMRRQVVGIEAVLADGRALRRLPGLAKDSTGYDLPGLLTGSEGTLAVITAVRLRLVPVLAARAVALLAVESTAAALSVYRQLRTRLTSLHAVEVVYPEGIDLVCDHAGLPAPFPDAGTAVHLLVECAAVEDPLDDLGAVVESASGILGTAVGTTAGERATLWAYRERLTEAINAVGVPHKLDVALPLGRLVAFEGDVRRIVADSGARLVLFGHLGDGNLHVNLLGLPPDDETLDDAVLRLVAAHGGSISAEHGIGVAKRRWLSLTRDAVDREAMAAVKRAFDPYGVLNPGVLLGS